MLRLSKQVSEFFSHLVPWVETLLAGIRDDVSGSVNRCFECSVVIAMCRYSTSFL